MWYLLRQKDQVGALGNFLEGDDKILQELIAEWEMERGGGVSTPVSREEGGKPGETNDIPLKDPDQITKYRRTAARLNYLSLDDPRIAYASKEISRWMSCPTEAGVLRVKRVIRYLREQPLCKWAFPWQNTPGELVGYSDSDWAGCAVSRRSTSGGGIKFGCHLIHHWSRTQNCVALSSGEAELNALLKTACEGLGIKYLFEEVGFQLGLVLFGDSSASHGTVQRLGSGKIKHLATRQLWLQERVYSREVAVKKVGRESNWADVLTLPCTQKDLYQFNAMGVYSCGWDCH